MSARPLFYKVCPSYQGYIMLSHISATQIMLAWAGDVSVMRQHLSGSSPVRTAQVGRRD